MDTAYVRDTPPPKIAENQVQYLHFWYLKLLLNEHGIESRWWFQISFIFTSKLGEDFQFDERIFFRWVATNHQPVHPGRLTWNLQITHFERNMIFQTIIFRFHVNLPVCNWWVCLNTRWVVWICETLKSWWCQRCEGRKVYQRGHTYRPVTHLVSWVALNFKFEIIARPKPKKIEV